MPAMIATIHTGMAPVENASSRGRGSRPPPAGEEMEAKGRLLKQSMVAL
jgi:hypothetical protein